MLGMSVSKGGVETGAKKKDQIKSIASTGNASRGFSVRWHRQSYAYEKGEL